MRNRWRVQLRAGGGCNSRRKALKLGQQLRIHGSENIIKIRRLQICHPIVLVPIRR
uniref:Uncharacterized protein n=1 Tax=Solanum lycopersicum TaxID=4081 RepID=A0A3Q7GNZ5_SOLLC